MPLITENEAKARLCPLKFAAEVGIACQASDCMAWRWELSADNVERRAEAGKLEGVRGYCGAFGRPAMFDMHDKYLDGDEPLPKLRSVAPGA